MLYYQQLTGILNRLCTKLPGIVEPGMYMSKFLYEGPLEELEEPHSTGPKSPQGKAKSSQNALRHGCCSKKTIIKGESEEEFEELLGDWMEEYRPKGKSVRMLVEQAAEAQWTMRRNTNRYHELEQSLQEKSIVQWTEEDHKQMERLLRYRTTAERSFTRAVNTLQQICERRERRAADEKQEREEARKEKAEAAKEETEAEIEEEIKTSGAMENPGKMEAIHVLDQWVDVVVENGRTITKLEPSNEQLLEDRLKMEPPPRAGVPEGSFQGWDTGRICVVL